MFTATMIWFASFVTLPAPTGPVRMALDPMAWNSGRTLSKVSCLPPAMMASVPSMALGSPPLTGASRKSTPLASHAAPTFCATRGLIELMSTRMDPRAAPSRAPAGPRIAASTSGPSGTIVMVTSERAATSLADSPRAAPDAAISATGSGRTS